MNYTLYEAQFAEVDGFAGIRAYADGDFSVLKNRDDWRPAEPDHDVNVLSISGGGSGGAFTAGILTGWTADGSRPNFDVVTGVSTGALIAPFAFLGPGYDRQLGMLYGGKDTQKLIDVNWQEGVVFGESLLKGRVLRLMVEKYITRDFLNAVAVEHRKGRRLFVMTTNLDSQRGVVWNMGAIAASGRPDSLALFRDVMVASASIPGVFPAVMLKASAGGRTIEEMHSDGGSSSQFFTLPDRAMAASGPLPLPSKRKKLHLFVIVNNALIPEFGVVERGILPVASRAYSALIKSQTKYALLALYNYAQLNGIDFKMASIDRQVPYSMADPFNADYMKTLFQLGTTEVAKRSVWSSKPIFEIPPPVTKIPSG